MKSGILVLARSALLVLSGLVAVVTLFHPQLRLVGGSFLGEWTEDTQISQRRLPWHTILLHEAMKARVPSYSRSQAAEAVRPTTWKCGGETTRSTTSPRTLVAFVHVYKAAGSTMRLFFRDVANACGKTWVLLSKCADVRPSSLRAPNTTWTPCRVSEVAYCRRGRGEQYCEPKGKSFDGKTAKKPNAKMSNAFVASEVDIIGGHMRVGTADNAFAAEDQGGMRHVVFLREPLERFVSGVLYQNLINKRKETSDEVLGKIKADIAEARRAGDYATNLFRYLLTPRQKAAYDHRNATELAELSSAVHYNSTSQFMAELNAKLAIQNMFSYNMIVGMTEDIPSSMKILKHVLANHAANESEVNGVFVEYGIHNDGKSTKKEVRANKSKLNGVSTDLILGELRKDAAFMVEADEYVKYEKIVVDYAWEMHKMQFEALEELVDESS